MALTFVRTSMRRRAPVAGLALAALVLASDGAAAQTEVDPGFNLFSKDQEVEIGRQSAAEVERELPLLDHPTVVAYVERVGERLASEAPGADYPYRFRVLNLAEANAFALPGGFVYVNRGLIETVRDEGELAGVLAHEIAHVALRHGTNQASKSYLAQAGLAVLGGILGDSTAGDIMGAVGGVGMPLLFLKFSRGAEEQADTAAAQILARAGYRPAKLASFFETLESSGRGGPPEFLSSHPSYANRRENIEREARLLDVDPRAPVGGLDRAQARLARAPDAPTMEEARSGRAASSNEGATRDRGRADVGRVPAPSSERRVFEQSRGYYRISYPANWNVYESRDAFSVTLAPEEGIVRSSTGNQEILYGLLVNHYQPFLNDDSGSSRWGSFGLRPSTGETIPPDLEDATQDVLLQVLDSNPHLQPVRDSAESLRIDGRPALQLRLQGVSPVTGKSEHVTLVTRNAGDGHVLYVLGVSSEDRRRQYEEAFQDAIGSLVVDDSAVHEERTMEN